MLTISFVRRRILCILAVVDNNFVPNDVEFALRDKLGAAELMFHILRLLETLILQKVRTTLGGAALYIPS